MCRESTGWRHVRSQGPSTRREARAAVPRLSPRIVPRSKAQEKQAPHYLSPVTLQDKLGKNQTRND